jgi:outer membrane lipoprotein carrier protein
MKGRFFPLLLLAVFAVAAAVAKPASRNGSGTSLLAGVERDEAPPAKTREAQAIVRTLEVRYHSAATLKAAFLERYNEGGRVLRVESGTVYFRRPGRMRWEYESPEQKVFVADGKTAWFYVPADRTVTRARMKESMDWRTPFALLTGKAKLSGICARIDLVSPPLVAAGHAVLRCLPRESGAKGRAEESGTAADARGENGGFREVLLEVEADRGDLVRVVVQLSGGVELEYRFGNWQQNPALPEALFHFQPPAGVAIVDESSISRPSP